MRRFLMNVQMNAPWWLWSLLVGLLFGGAMGLVFQHHSHGGSAAGWIAGLLCGAVYGGITGPFIARQQRRAPSVPVLGPLTPEEHRAVQRAAWRGPVPADEELRRAAGRLAAYRLDEVLRHRPLALAVVGFVLVFTVFSAVATSAWWWLAVAYWALLTAGLLWLFPRRLRRRVELLADPR